MTVNVETKIVTAVITPKHRHQILASVLNNTFKMNINSSNCTDQSGTTVISVKTKCVSLTFTCCGKQKHTARESKSDF